MDSVKFSSHPAAPKWVPNMSRSTCQRCLQKFSLITRRHHCRACGGLMCGDCSSFERSLPQFGYGDRLVRVCIDCNSKSIHQIQTEVKAFIISDKVYTLLKKVFGMGKPTKEINSVSLMSFAETLARLRPYESVSSDFIDFVEKCFQQLAIYQYYMLKVDAEKLTTTASNYLEKVRTTGQGTMSNLLDVGICYNDLRKFLDTRDSINRAVARQASPFLVERINSNLPEGYTETMDALVQLSSKLFQKEAAPNIDKALLLLCKERVTARQLHLQLDSLSPRSRRNTEPKLSAVRVHTEEYLNKFVASLREAHGNPYVSKEVLKVAHEFLYHVIVSSFKENYHLLLRAADNPDLMSIYLALSQSFRLLSIAAEFSEHVDIRPPLKYRGLLKEIKILAQKKIKYFPHNEKVKLEEMLDRWPLASQAKLEPIEGF